MLKTGSNTWTEFTTINYSGYREITWSCDTTSTNTIFSVGCAGGLNTTSHRAVITYDGVNNASPTSYTLLLDGASQTVLTGGQFFRQSTDLTSLGGRWDGTTLTNSRDLNWDCLALWSGVKTAEQIAQIDAWLLKHQ